MLVSARRTTGRQAQVCRCSDKREVLLSWRGFDHAPIGAQRWSATVDRVGVHLELPLEEMTGPTRSAIGA